MEDSQRGTSSESEEELVPRTGPRTPIHGKVVDGVVAPLCGSAVHDPSSRHKSRWGAPFCPSQAQRSRSRAGVDAVHRDTLADTVMHHATSCDTALFRLVLVAVHHTILADVAPHHFEDRRCYAMDNTTAACRNTTRHDASSPERLRARHDSMSVFHPKNLPPLQASSRRTRGPSRGRSAEHRPRPKPSRSNSFGTASIIAPRVAPATSSTTMRCRPTTMRTVQLRAPAPSGCAKGAADRTPWAGGRLNRRSSHTPAAGAAPQARRMRPPPRRHAAAIPTPRAHTRRAPPPRMG